jgi:hypothetical protein
MQVRVKERRTMLAQKQDNAANDQRSNQKIGAEIHGTIHVRHEIVPWFDERSNAALKREKCGVFVLMVPEERCGISSACLGFCF